MSCCRMKNSQLWSDLLQPFFTSLLETFSSLFASVSAAPVNQDVVEDSYRLGDLVKWNRIFSLTGDSTARRALLTELEAVRPAPSLQSGNTVFMWADLQRLSVEPRSLNMWIPPLNTFLCVDFTQFAAWVAPKVFNVSALPNTWHKGTEFKFLLIICICKKTSMIQTSPQWHFHECWKKKGNSCREVFLWSPPVLKYV